MDAIGLFRLSFDEMHRAVDEEIADTPLEWLWWQPGPDLNHIGFLLWHLTRDEDEVVQRVVGGRAPVWEARGWAERFGMARREQGTGMDSAVLPDFRYPFAEFLHYAEAVWQATDEVLARLSEARLDELVNADFSPTMTIASQLGTGILCHSWVHLGEVRAIKGLKGWRYRE